MLLLDSHFWSWRRSQGKIWPKLITFQMKKLTLVDAQDTELQAKLRLRGPGLGSEELFHLPSGLNLPSSAFEIWTLCLFVSGFSDEILKVYPLLKMSGTLWVIKKEGENVRGKGQPRETRNSRRQEGIDTAASQQRCLACY